MKTRVLKKNISNDTDTSELNDLFEQMTGSQNADPDIIIPKIIKISPKFLKDKNTLSALTKLTGKDFENYISFLKSKEKDKLKVGERLIWNDFTILFGSGSKNIPIGSEPYDSATSWRDTRNKALRARGLK